LCRRSAWRSGDGFQEIIFTTDSDDYSDPASVYAINGDNASVAWQFIVNRNNYGAPDGGNMTTVGNYYYDGSYHSLMPERSTFTSEVSPIPVADIDNDGKSELITTWKIRPVNSSGESGDYHQDYNPLVNDVFGFAEFGTVGESWSGGSLSLNLNGTRKFLYHIHQLVEAGCAVGNVGRNVNTPFVLNDSDAIVCYDITGSTADFCNTMLHGQFGKNQRMISGTYKGGIDVHAADIDGDGKDECLSPARFTSPLWQPHLTILDDNGHILWREWGNAFVRTNWANMWPCSACMIPCNPDNDNRANVIVYKSIPELSYYEWNGLELVLKWKKSFGKFLPSQPVVGDVDGDGIEEIVVGVIDPTDDSATVANALTVINISDGSTKDTLSLEHGIKQAPVLVDADKDGDLDVVARAWDRNGQLIIASFGNGDTGKVSWASHYKNNERKGWLGKNLYPQNTPFATNKISGLKSVKFFWSMPKTSPNSFKILRAENVDAAYSEIASVGNSVAEFTDKNLADGEMYAYQIVADFGAYNVTSPPFAVLSLVPNNLLCNSGFEENGDSNWDKWYTGDLPWQWMTRNSDAYQGRFSMRIVYTNSTNDSTIKQFNPYGIPDATVYVKKGGNTLYSYGAWMKTGNMNSNSEHRLEISSSHIGEDYTFDEGVSADYPNYYTPHFNVPSGGISDWTYVNRVTYLRADKPCINLRHRTYSDNLTGEIFLDNIFFREVNTNLPEILAFAQNWKYNDSGLTPAANWFQPNFDDSGWSSGTAPLGNGSGVQRTTEITRYNDFYWFRNKFNLTNNLGETIFYGLSLDEIEVWINGTKIPAQTIYETQSSANEIRCFDLTPITELFINGTNTIAVRMSNVYNATWDNIQFDCSIEGEPLDFEIPEPVLFINFYILFFIYYLKKM